MRKLFVLGALVLATLAGAADKGNVIFIHPDGTGVNTWGVARMLYAGPDGHLNWDRLEAVGIYRGHMRDSLAATSNGGGAAHAYGVRPTSATFGIDEGKQLVSASGKPLTVMMEAKQAGLAVGVINSAGVVDAGTGIFLASTASRREYAEIARQMLESGAEVLMGGGEAYFLPEGTEGRHGPGQRTDGRNLIDEAKVAGYAVVYTRDELMALPGDTKKVLGLFAAEDTFNDESEEALRAAGKPLFNPTAPTVAEMLKVALQVFRSNGRQFFVVCEEEATDNFAGATNAMGVLTALKRADDAIGVALEFMEGDPNTLIVTAADSDCGGMQLWGEPVSEFDVDQNLPDRDPETGSMIDGPDGTGSKPFLAQPDTFGVRLPFGVMWAGGTDMSGGIAARAHGLNSGLLGTNVFNTDIYRIIYTTLFGRPPAP